MNHRINEFFKECGCRLLIFGIRCFAAQRFVFAHPEALDYGDKCWSRILSNWHEVREQGLTRHENWWPAVYAQACAAWGVEPDPKARAFDQTYEGQRADLKAVSVSA